MADKPGSQSLEGIDEKHHTDLPVTTTRPPQGGPKAEALRPLVAPFKRKYQFESADNATSAFHMCMGDSAGRGFLVDKERGYSFASWESDRLGIGEDLKLRALGREITIEAFSSNRALGGTPNLSIAVSRKVTELCAYFAGLGGQDPDNF